MQSTSEKKHTLSTFTEPELQLVEFELEDFLSNSPNNQTDETDPNQGTWIPVHKP